ncbi:hypothetical protein Nhal_1018 [Nitrosococcus halophilus Nc 4]|uniref:Antirepressor protein ant N-terminal domain-containing protein n=1 Tax=Nitrosococcus halophilus (strain Nc4) TaxID=472759 RepID=D5BYX8_NITHN|nr:phage antirepressor N-terminal domain-containing protein [Nitrosococcus halophilus]ADE14191.1 hypothetical protein Nhal_1018 [Nitrosococcus halophilus Nc 4]
MNAITVPFHGTDLFVVEYQGQPYTPMKPIVEGMGLDWKSQHAKLQENQSRWSTMVISTIVAGDGKIREMLCMPLRKLVGWLMTIYPNKVKPEIRDNIIRYQNECDDVLWRYWTEGQVTREATQPEPLRLTTKEQREPLIKAVRRLVSVSHAKGRPLTYEDAHSIINLKMGVDSVEALTLEQIPKAMTLVGEILERVVLEGEYIGKDDAPYYEPEPRISHDQRRKLHEAIVRALGGAHRECGESGQQWVHNRLRVKLNLRHIEDMHPDQFPEAMAEIEQLDQDLGGYFKLRAELRQFVCREIIGAGTPWTPHLAKQWEAELKQAVPPRPDWLVMREKLLSQ